MPVSIVKAKVKQAVKAPKGELVQVEPKDMALEDLADRYGELEDRCDALLASPEFAQFKLVEEELKKRMGDYEPDEVVKIIGKHWELDVGACSKSPRKITDVMAVMKFIGSKAFAEIAKVGVDDAEKYLTPEQFEKVVSETAFTKNRKVKKVFLG